jgi:hypothetical protein
MPWKFDPFIVDIVWVPPTSTMNEPAIIDFGEKQDSDVLIDMGDRSNDSSIVDQGLRVFDGDI